MQGRQVRPSLDNDSSIPVRSLSVGPVKVWGKEKLIVEPETLEADRQHLIDALTGQRIET